MKRFRLNKKNVLGFSKQLIKLGAERTIESKDTRQIGYIGGQGGGNLGDEAIYQAATQLLSPIKMVEYGGATQERILGHLNLSGKDFFQNICLGGGTLINSGWLNQVKQAARQNVPMWSLGTGVGSCGFNQPKSVNISEWIPILKSFQRISVRGPISQTRLESLGIGGVEIVGDPALIFTSRKYSGTKKIGTVAVNFAAPSQENSEQAWRKDSVESLKYLKKQGWSILPVAMHETDVRIIEDVIKEAGYPRISVPVYTSVDQFLQSVAQCDFIIAVRLHAAILSCCTSVPPILISYRDKCNDFMGSMNLNDLIVEGSGLNSGRLLDLTKNLATHSKEIRPSVEKIAFTYAQLLSEYVKNFLTAETSLKTN